MKAIVLCGGFAKRLMPLSKNKAKSLIFVGKKPMIEYILEMLDELDDVDEIFISVNEKYDEDFKEFLNTVTFKKSIKIVVEETEKEEEKLGSLGGIIYVVGKENINEECIIIAGDNVIDFDLKDFVNFYRNKQKPILGAFDIKNKEETKKFGVLVVGEDDKVVEFVEKPPKSESTLISMCCYVFPAQTLKMLKRYIDEGNNKDAPGYFIQWLIKKDDVFAFVFNGTWYDIGDLKTLEKARKFLESKELK